MHRRRQNHSHLISKAMAQHRTQSASLPSHEEADAATGHPGLESLVADGLDQSDEGGQLETIVTVPSAQSESAAEESYGPVSATSVTTITQTDHRPMEAEVRTRPHRNGWLRPYLFLILLLVAAGFVHIRTDLVVPATVVEYGSDKAVRSTHAGTVREILVREGDAIRQGERLLLIEPPIPKSLITASRDWAGLRLQEERLMAQIAGRERLSMPALDLPHGVELDLGAMLAGQERMLMRDLREDDAMLGSLQTAVTEQERLRADALAGRAAVQGQLDKARARYRKARSMRDRNVVYEDGVYTEQLIKTLAVMIGGLKRDLEARVQVLESVEAEVRARQDALIRLRGKRVERLFGLLSEARDALPKAWARISEIEGRLSPVEVRSAWSGAVQELHGLRPGREVAEDDVLLTLHVPGDSALLEPVIPLYEQERVYAGQQARVSFLSAGTRMATDYSGVMTSVSASADGVRPDGRGYGMLLEVSVPAGPDIADLGIRKDMRALVEIATDYEAVWHYLWRRARQYIAADPANAARPLLARRPETLDIR